jgi:hypothetical protein
MGMENLMKALMESAMASQQQQQQPAAPQGGGDALSQVLGGLLGGAQQPAAPQGGGDLLSGVLGGLLGGGAPQGGNSGDAMLGALEQIIGGQPGTGQTLGLSQAPAMSMGAGDPIMGLLQPIVGQLAAKVNIPPQIAMVVASVAVHYLLSSHPSTSPKAPMDLGGFMQQLSSGRVSTQTLHDSGMVRDVMQATGLSQQQAVKSLDATFGVLGESVAGAGGRRMNG